MTKGRFAGQVVMITGAAGGFGAAAAKRFAAEGAALVLSDLDKPGLQRLAEECRKMNINLVADQVDITSESDVISHIEQSTHEIGAPTICINNAGIGQSLLPIQATDTDQFDRVMAVNAKSVFLCMKHQIPSMIAARSGAILNVASAAGLVGAGHMAAYAASKHAVVGLTKSAADEVARYGVRINAICPSFAPTKLFNDMADEVGVRHGEDRQAAYARTTARIPMRRLATIDEVVQAMLWACEPANSFMTGQAISIDGGLTAI